MRPSADSLGELHSLFGSWIFFNTNPNQGDVAYSQLVPVSYTAHHAWIIGILPIVVYVV
jgi:hypothetical protein